MKLFFNINRFKHLILELKIYKFLQNFTLLRKKTDLCLKNQTLILGTPLIIVQVAEEEDEDDLLEEYSAHKEDDLMNNEAEMVKPKEKEKEKTNKFKKIFRRIKKSIKLNCLQFSSFQYLTYSL